MPGPVVSLFTVLTFTLVFLVGQAVSHSMLDPAVSLLIVFTLTLVLFTLQKVSDYMLGLAAFFPTVILILWFY